MNEIRLLAKLRDRDGAVERLMGLIRRRRIPVREWTVATVDDGMLEVLMRVTLRGLTPERITAELKSLVDLGEVVHLEEDAPLSGREMAVVRIAVPRAMVTPPGGRVISVEPDSVVIELTGSRGEIDAALDLLRRECDGIRFVRTGEIAVPENRGGAPEAE